MGLILAFLLFFGMFALTYVALSQSLFDDDGDGYA